MIQEFRFPASLGACALSLCLATPSLAQETDTVYLAGGTSETGKVLESSFSGLSFQPEKGAKKVVPWETVLRVDYFDAPEDLQLGLAALNAGNAEAALQPLEAALASEGIRPPLVQEALFHLSYAEQRVGQAKEAADGYTKLLTNFPKGRYLRMAGENLLALRLAANDTGGAQSTVTTLSEGAKGLEGVEAVIGLLEARLLEGQNKAAEAGLRYAAVEALAGAAPGLVQEAKLGRARMLLGTDKAGEAEPIFRELTIAGSSSRVLSGAWNSLGELQAKDGRAKKNSERILDGLYAYLRTVVQYKPLPGESTEEYERAVAGAENCFRLLSELEQNPEKKRKLRDLEHERHDQLQQEYPNSVYLKK
ncbi:MAG: tetratricopeptide repeat protein [Planctomycetes bacterium]|nr:tetratricopeptide repeat protein [Planctomycetota bacterium]